MGPHPPEMMQSNVCCSSFSLTASFDTGMLEVQAVKSYDNPAEREKDEQHALDCIISGGWDCADALSVWGSDWKGVPIPELGLPSISVGVSRDYTHTIDL